MKILLKVQFFHEFNTVTTCEGNMKIYTEKDKILELWMPETGKCMSGANRNSGSGVQ